MANKAWDAQTRLVQTLKQTIELYKKSDQKNMISIGLLEDIKEIHEEKDEQNKRIIRLLKDKIEIYEKIAEVNNGNK